MSKSYSKTYIRSIAEELVEELRECEDGTVTSTRELAKQSLYDDLDDMDLFELDKALMQAAKANKITLDLSEHDNNAAGLPYNLPFVVHNQKAQIKCPRCGSIDTARYIDGYPMLNKKMQEKLDKGKWTLGGCLIYTAEVNGQTVEVMPKRHCNVCNKDFGTPPVLLTRKKDLAEDYRDIVKSIKMSVWSYLGAVEITIRKNENGAIAEVMVYGIAPGVSGTKQITADKWNQIVNTLYGQLYLHEWKKDYTEELMLDGTDWNLDIKLTNNRTRHYHGSNTFPPYWNELKKVFRQFAKL